MVKGFDPTQSDPTTAFLNYLFAIFHKPSPLSPTYAAECAKKWIGDPTTKTSQLYLQLKDRPTKPKIIMQRHCSKPLFSYLPSDGDEFFPAYQREEEIHLCLNNIQNKIELK